jgi:hypothetical protein
MVSREAVSSPGPGIYESPSKFGREGTKYTIGGKKEHSY